MTARLQAEILTPGSAVSAPPLILTAPISFWGGVDPASGAIIDARHPERGRCVAGMALGLPGTIGSSSASSVLLELVRAGRAPAALLMPEPDAILLLGLIVAREMGWRTPPALRLPAADQRAMAGAPLVTVGADGALSW